MTSFDTAPELHAATRRNDGTRGYDLLWVYGADSPQRLHLAPSLHIGREEQWLVLACKRAAEDATLSRAHCRVWHAGDHVYVEDSGSRNGTFVDGARILRPTEIGAGAVVRAGGSLFVLDHARTGIGRFGLSSAAHDLEESVKRLATADVSVVLLGESGVGKEVAARALHELSGKSGAFVAINAATIPEALAESVLFGHRRGAFTDANRDAQGLFASANEGTLFLDEVADLPASVQAKLLRTLESGEVLPVGDTSTQHTTARVLAATNKDLRGEVAAGRFRHDLYARLNQDSITLPPLRARHADILPLFNAFIADTGERVRYDAAFAEHVLHATWPLNVRELKSFAGRVSRAGVTELQADDFARLAPEASDAESTPGTPPTQEALEALLVEHQGNVSRIARAVGKNARQVYRWLERAGIDPNRFRG